MAVQMIGSAIQAYQPPPSYFGVPGMSGAAAPGAAAAPAAASPYAALLASLGGGAARMNTPMSAADIQSIQAGGMAPNKSLGQLQQGIGYASMANRAVGGGATVGGALGAAGGFLSMYNGIQQGGVMGYGSAVVGGLRGASAVAGLMGNAGAAGALGAAAGYVAAPLAVYSAVKNWKSGSTGSDTLQGAEAGAAIGSVILPGVGTAIGAGIGAAVGAVSSAFGGGQSSVEALTAQAYTATFDKATPAQKAQLAQMASPAQNVQYLQGIMDGHNSSAGHESDLQAAFGKNNVAGFTTQMTETVNSAISSGKISRNATPQQIYTSVVQPWLASKSGGAKSGSDVKGNSVSAAEQASIMGVISQWQDGVFTSASKVGVKGQSINIPSYGG
jgi:hypothetical protein